MTLEIIYLRENDSNHFKVQHLSQINLFCTRKIAFFSWKIWLDLLFATVVVVVVVFVIFITITIFCVHNKAKNQIPSIFINYSLDYSALNRCAGLCVCECGFATGVVYAFCLLLNALFKTIKYQQIAEKIQKTERLQCNGKAVCKANKLTWQTNFLARRWK